MKKYFLDTSFLIDLVKERVKALKIHEGIKGNEVTGSPCIYELSKFTQFDLSQIFGQNEILDFTAEDAEVAGNIYYRLSQRGKMVGELDLIIAGMIKNRNLVLVTRDLDFKKIQDIDLKTYQL